MVENSRPPVRPAARSPRSAELAGIVFSLLSAASMVLPRNTVATNLADITPAWLEAWSGAVSVVLVLVPLAGIAFLWFTGLIRDLVGEREDR